MHSSPRAARTRGSLISCGIVAAMAGIGCGTAFASGFALLEQSASRLGTAFSGTAAATDDVTTVFYNPAGMSTLRESQTSLVVTGIDIASEFANRDSTSALGQPLGIEGGDAGGWNLVPAAYFATPINDQLAVGFAFNAPFGLKLEYDPEWMGRFQALDSEIKVYNLSPALSWRLNQMVSIGFGLDYQKVQAELTNQVNYTAVVAQGVQQLVATGQLPPAQAPLVLAANAGLSGAARVRGDDAQWGYHVGVLFELPSQTRIGLSYRSSIEYELEGSASFSPPAPSNPTGAAIVAAASQSTLATGPASLDLEMPDNAILSVAQAFGQDFELLLDIAWTGWSSVQELRIVRDSGVTLSVVPELWDDTWRVGFGGVYRLDETWKIRAGVAYDESPVPSATRTARLPDADRRWIAIGAQWSASPKLTVDAGYAHLFVHDARISQDAGSALANGFLGGTQESGIDIVSAQFTYRW